MLRNIQAEGEDIVLAANRSSPLLTVALQPNGVFGTDINNIEGDAQTVAAMYAAYAHGVAASILLSTSKLNTIPPEDDRIDGVAFLVTNGSVGDEWMYEKVI
jgi:hypothetical protein